MEYPGSKKQAKVRKRIKRRAELRLESQPTQPSSPRALSLCFLSQPSSPVETGDSLIETIPLTSHELKQRILDPGMRTEPKEGWQDETSQEAATRSKQRKNQAREHSRFRPP
ncbi:unnamed protein product [Ilex paraguariensis]|uniref:Uncharacterized protein n=1 Tax=Ilex paraguariensis TaxID=185542 RepID=A0ABC8S940_9AQUA